MHTDSTDETSQSAEAEPARPPMLSIDELIDLYENAPDMMCSVDAGTAKIQHCNQTLATSLGYTKDEIVGHPIFAMYDPGCMDGVRAAFQSFVEIGEVHNAELQLRRKDGSTIDVSLNVSANRNAQGAVVSSRSVWRDITERKQADEQLWIKDQAIQSSLTGMCFIDMEGRITDCNPAFLKLWRAESIDDLKGVSVFDLGPNAEKNHEILDAVQRTGSWEGESIARCLDGTQLDLAVACSLIQIDSKPVGIIGTCRDITEQKHAEQELAASEKRFRALAEALPVSIGVAQDGRRAFGNRFAEELTGYSRDELSGRQAGTVTHPDYRERILQQLNDCLENGVSSRQESKIVRKDGQERWVDFSCTPIEWNGRPATLGASIDITDRKLAEQALRESEENFRILADTVPISLNITQHHRRVFCNQQSVELTGYPVDELIGQETGSLSHPDSHEQWLKTQRSCWDDGVPARHEGKIIRKDGQIRWVDCSAAPFQWDGSPAVLSASIDITEHKLAERQLRQSQHFLRRILDTSPSVIFAKDGDSRILFANNAVAKFYGMNENNVVGKLQTELHAQHGGNSADLEKWLNDDRHVREIGETLEVVETAIDSTGARHHFHTSKCPLELDTGQRGVLVVSFDITARTQAEDELRASLARQQLIIKSANIGLWDWDLRTDEVIFSSEWKGQLGYADDEIPNNFNSWESRLHPDDRERTLAATQEFLVKRQTDYSIEFRLRHRDGSWRWVLALADVQRDATGEPTRMMGCHVDITDLKRAERALRASENRLRTIFEQEPECVKLVDRDGTLLQMNPAGLAAIEADSLEQVVGQSIYPVICAEHLDAFKELNRAVFEGKTRKLEFEIQGLKGTRLWVETNAAPLRNAEGEIIALLAVTRDITDRLAAEQQRVEAHRREVLLKEVHHRVKNNLQVVSSLLFLQSSYLADDKSREFLRESQNRVKSIALIHEKLYRSDDSENVDFGEYVRDLTLDLVHTYSIDQAAVTLSTEIDDVSIHIDTATPCGLIINELISNALKHAFPAGRHGHVEVGLTSTDDGEFQLTVRDDGVGLPAGFEWEKAASFGLRLVMDLSKQINGSVEIDTSHGTVFAIRFMDIVHQDHEVIV
jgi:PAS domain S-box-containing protein